MILPRARARRAVLLLAAALAASACPPAPPPPRDATTQDTLAAGDEGAAPDTDAGSDAETAPAPVPVPAGFEVHAHRGGRALRPENTLAAFEHALELGADALETDLHLSRDGVVVLWHDAFVTRQLCRVAPGAAAPLPPDPDALPANAPALMVRALDFAQLQKYRCDRNPAPGSLTRQAALPGAVSGDAYGIASLAALLDFVTAYAGNAAVAPERRARAAQVRFNLETKRDPAHPEYIGDGFDGASPGELERTTVALVRARGLVARTTVQSFDHRSLWAARTLEPGLRLSFLTNGTPVDFADYAARGARVWSPIGLEVTRARVAEAHARGLRVLPWTIDDASTARRLIGLGVDGLITDAPDVINAAVAR